VLVADARLLPPPAWMRDSHDRARHGRSTHPSSVGPVPIRSRPHADSRSSRNDDPVKYVTPSVNEFEQGETEDKRLWHQTIGFSTQTLLHKLAIVI